MAKVGRTAVPRCGLGEEEEEEEEEG